MTWPGVTTGMLVHITGTRACPAGVRFGTILPRCTATISLTRGLIRARFPPRPATGAMARAPTAGSLLVLNSAARRDVDRGAWRFAVSLREHPAAVAIAALLAIGCGMASDGAGGSSAPSDASHEQAAAVCDALFACECGLAEELDACIAAEAEDFESVIAAGEENDLSFDAGCLQARLDRFERLKCDPTWANAGPVVDCKLHYGTGELGMPCVVVDAADGDTCTINLLCLGGICRARQTYSVGEECYVTWPGCEDGSFCQHDDDSDSYHCVGLPQAGEPCLYGTGGLCRAGLLCDASSFCADAPDLGEVCGPPGYECSICHVCDAQGRCVSPPSSGEPCIDGRCADGATCTDGVCEGDAPFVCWGGATETQLDPLSSKLCPDD